VIRWRLANQYAYRKALGNDGRVRLWRSFGATIADEVTIGPETTMRFPEHVTIGHRSFLGKVHLDAWEHITIGSNVLLNEARLFAGSHDVNSPDFKLKPRPITVGDWAWIATGVMVLPGVQVGEAAVVGAGSVVATDVPAYEVWAGNPARRVADRARVAFTYVPR
jgi:putative colanic acid biosynthesis acetyltransferase WcaF